MKETNDSGFLGTVPTLHTQLLADNSMLQVRLGGQLAACLPGFVCSACF